MDSGRKQLAAILKEALPAWQHVSDKRNIDAVLKPAACVVWASERKRMPLNGFNCLVETVEVWVLSASSDVTKIEDDLDDRLMDVLDVIEPLTEFKWDTASRGILENHDGWKIEITCGYTIKSA